MSQPIEPKPVPPRGETTQQASSSSAGIEKSERVVTDAGGDVHLEQTVRDVAGEQAIGLVRATQSIWLFFGIVEILIGLRFLLKLIGSNPNNAFASFIYSAAHIFVGPFLSLTGSPAAGGAVFEFPSLVAMLVYALLGWLIVRIVRVVWSYFSRSATSSTSTYDRYNR